MLFFRLLGPLEAWDGDRQVDLGGQRQRSLLALLLLSANRVVPTDTLVDALWGEEPPRTATTSLHNAVSQLRRALGPDVLQTRPPGYVLQVPPGGLDLVEFERLLERARSEPPEQRSRTLREALSLWGGPALADVAFERFATDEVRRLEELRLVANEERLEADLAAGRAGDVVAELEGLVAHHPYRERLRALLMLALYRSNRQAEALQVFHDLRRVLDEELGLEPGPELRELHRRILVQDASLHGSARVAASSPDHHAAIQRALISSRLVPVMGLKTASGAPDPANAAERLARTFGCPAEVASSLTRVAQYVTVTHGVGPLYDELDALYGSDYEPGAAHRLLASLPPLLRERELPQQLIVTTGYDTTLERAFREAGEPLDVVSYIALGPDRGKFLHLTAEGSARVIDEPNLEIGLTTDERTILLKIHGGSGGYGDRDRESYVVSEDDYIDFLAGTQASGLLPVGLAARLRRSHFLFLGYELEEWTLRVFLRRLWGEERLAYRSWAVGSATDRLAAEYWRRRGVEPIDVELDPFVEELARRLADRSETRA
jgi:DNA-binding SARP family transcriptional activator